MKKKVFSIFISLIFMSGAVIAEDTDKPFLITNTLDCNLSIGLNEEPTDILPQRTLKLSENAFPFTTSGYCSNSTSFGFTIVPADKDKKYTPGCYEIRDAGKLVDPGKNDNGQPLFKIEAVSCPMQPLKPPSVAP